MLLDGGIEKALHDPVIANALNDVSLKAVLGRDAGGHEPLHSWIGNVKIIVE
jgi:hypothetical protein